MIFGYQDHKFSARSARKRRVPAEKCSCRSTKRLICLKQKNDRKKWVPVASTSCPHHLSTKFLTTSSTFPCISKNSSAENIHILSTRLTLTNTITHTLTHSLARSHRQTRTLSHRHIQTDSLTHRVIIKIVSTFGWGISRAAWKGRGRGQELSAEVIRAPGWSNWYPLFDQSLFFKHISLYAPTGAFSSHTFIFPATAKIVRAKLG